MIPVDDPSTGVAKAVLEAADLAGIGVAAAWVDPPVAEQFYVNDAYTQLTGYTLDELRGLGPFGNMPPDVIPEMTERFQRRSSGDGTPARFTTALLHRDGRRLAVDLSLICVAFSGRRAVVCFVQDVTEREHSLAALARSEANLRRVVEQAPEPIAVMRDGRTVLANDALATLFGYETPSQILGRSVNEFIRAEDAATYRERFERAARGESISKRLYRNTRADGSVRTVEWSSTRIDFQGEPAVLSFGRDVTELLQLEAQLAQAQRLAALGTLAAGVAHEINNPLTFLLLRVEALEGSLRTGSVPALPELAAALADVRVGAERVRDTVGELRTFSRADDSRRVLVDLSEVAGTALRLVRHAVPGHVQLTQDLGAVLAVLGTPGPLGQVVTNLVVNAAQALASIELGPGSIHIRTWSEGRRTLLEVGDTGPGIPEDALAHVFDPFFTTKQVGEGMGLGLSICHRIVTGHGGTIRARNAERGGALFLVDLPAAEADGDADRRCAPDASGVTARARVVVVDDEPAIANLLRTTLAVDHDVTVFTNGEEALSFLLDQPVDALVCDLMMPGLSGMDLVENLERAGNRAASRVVVMTGGAFTPRAARFVAQTGRRVLEKPFTADAIARVVREICAATSD